MKVLTPVVKSSVFLFMRFQPGFAFLYELAMPLHIVYVFDVTRAAVASHEGGPDPTISLASFQESPQSIP